MPSSNRSIYKNIKDIESLYQQDLAGRGIAPLTDYFEDALFNAAHSIANHPSPRIAILTGFFIPGASASRSHTESGPPPTTPEKTAEAPQNTSRGAAETDGPPAAATFAAALAQLKLPVSIVSDSFCGSAVEAATLEASSTSIPIQIIQWPPDDRTPPPENKTSSTQTYRDVSELKREWSRAASPVTHVISIERAGPASDGHPRNMRGEDISPWTAPLHELFSASSTQPAWITIGIGDGGNELGMGSLPASLIEKNVLNGAEIACRVPATHLLVCGVSNWGGYGLLAALALLRPAWHEIIAQNLTPARGRRILNAMLQHGPAVDGVTRLQTISVDGLSWEHHQRLLERLCSILEQGRA